MTTYINTAVNPLGTLQLSDQVYNIVLAANTAKTLNRNEFPSDATHVVINSTVSALMVKAGGTAAVPGADIKNGTGVTIDPVFIELASASSLSFINATACVVSLSFYKVA